MTSYTLVVDVGSANGLSGSPGSLNPCVELRFAGQRFTTSVLNRDCRPVAWNETIRFSALDIYKVRYSTLEAYVYNVIGGRKSFVGRVRLSGSTYADSLNEVIANDYPLRGGIFPRWNGTLHLKVLLEKEHPIETVDPLSRVVPSRSLRGAEGEAAGVAVKEFKPSLRGPVDAAPKEFKPTFEHGKIVEHMAYVFVHVVKARDLPSENARGRLDRYVQVKAGDYSGTTECMDMEQNAEWNATFAFSQDEMDRNQLKSVCAILKNMDGARDDSVGMVSFDVSNIRASHETRWRTLVDETSRYRTKGELMLAVWRGSQFDEKFANAWKSDSCMGPTVYDMPRLWYLRVHIIELQCDQVASDSGDTVEMDVTAALGDQLHRTTRVKKPLGHHAWNQQFMFVAAEPFEEHLQISVQAHLGPPDRRHRVIGEITIPVGRLDKRFSDRPIRLTWYRLQMPIEEQAVGCGWDDQLTGLSCNICLRTCLEGGYTVQCDSPDYADDVRPAARQIVDRATVGFLEIGIIGAIGLSPRKRMDGKEKLHPYCVAKYGKKWVRTRTVKNSCNPAFNDQYSWEVYDTSTVLTIGVFDNAQLEGYSSEQSKAVTIGKVRTRISFLQPGRTYTKSYPLLALSPEGVKPLGELRLALRFSADSVVKLLRMYSSPILPKMHYKEKLSMIEQENLRVHAVGILAARFSQMDPPLWKEVVEYMFDVRSNLWSMRKSKTNFFRFTGGLNFLFRFAAWFDRICSWKNPVTTLLIHAILVMLVSYPEIILPGVPLYILFVTLWNYRYRPVIPPHVNTRISFADVPHPDELDEEFDTFPTSQNLDVLRMRYDRLRSVAGRVQTVLGDLASHLERIQFLVSWRDTTATAIFVIFTLSAALVLYFTPWKILVLLTGLYTMRHPMLRRKTQMPTILANIYWRLPRKTDFLL